MRFDLATLANETVTIPAAQVKRLLKAANKMHHDHDPANPRLITFPVRKTGLYRLQKVLGPTNFEIQPRSSDALVVACPHASVVSPGSHRCRGDLSNVTLQVRGTPPLKLKYRKIIKGEDREMTLQSIQPEGYISPLGTQSLSQTLVRRDVIDISWAQSHDVSIALNEMLATAGEWQYVVDEVGDVFGNVVNYVAQQNQNERAVRLAHLQESFTVHDRPVAALDGCDLSHPIKIAKGTEARLPVRFGSSGSTSLQESAYTLTYRFARSEDLAPSSNNEEPSQLLRVSLQNTSAMPTIKEPGFYTLHSVSTQYCEGEILEPSTCLLENPPEPDLSITSELIFDKCAGNPVGFRVALDLIGNPPFHVQLSSAVNGVKRKLEYKTIYGLRGELELIPENAGHYTYRFTEISDEVYSGQSLREKNLILEADFQPAASASFVPNTNLRKQACLDEPVAFDVNMQGAKPFTLEYELVHGDRRTKYEERDITEDRITIETERLRNGGEYILNLAGITDGLGCKELLNQEAHISVRHQRPRASFGHLEGKRSVRSLEGKQVSLPVRLTGEAPWAVSYHTKDLPGASLKTVNFTSSNSFLKVSSAGDYELTDVCDVLCPGSVDGAANLFEVLRIPRPELAVIESSSLHRSGNKYLKDAVCLGDEDVLEISLNGQ